VTADHWAREYEAARAAWPGVRLGAEGWIRVTATRLARDIARGTKSRSHRTSTRTLAELASEAVDPEIALLKKALGASFQRALRQAIASLKKRERAVLRMHLAEGLSIDDIARPYRVHRATAARWLSEIKRKLLDQVQAHVRAAHGRSATATWTASPDWWRARSTSASPGSTRPRPGHRPRADRRDPLILPPAE
jgi:RNA polymerase sigma factor (sigma-70 family)